MDMSGWLTVAPRLESVSGPDAFLPCCKKFKLMWHSGHVGARHAQWFMPLISSRGHFKWKHREFANFTARHCRGKVQCLCTWRDSQHCREAKQRLLNAASVKNTLTYYLLALSSEADERANKAAATEEDLCYHHLNRLRFNIQSNKGCGAEGDLQSSGLLEEYSKLLSLIIHHGISSKMGKNKTDVTLRTFGKPWWQRRSLRWKRWSISHRLYSDVSIGWIGL